MPANNLFKAAILTALLVVIVIGGWEIYLRHSGITISYDNGKELWADKRAMVYEPSGKTTVFIGSSRIKFDLDIDTWQQVTGRHAVQLAIEGSSPRPVLTDLGNDPGFKGKLVVDVTEGLFFSTDKYNLEKPETNVAWYKSRTPAQKASFLLNHVLESQFVFLDEASLSLNAQLNKLPVPNRPGVFVFPTFPMDFRHTGFDRQNKMTAKFLADTSLQHQVQNIWVFVMKMGKNAPPPKEDPVPPIMRSVQAAVDKIRARGGEVVFVRTPSSGPFWGGEQHAFPRTKLWDPLLAATHCTGIHFADYPSTDHFICPEWSHLSPQDAVLYTRALIGQLPRSFVQ
ncbi:MAG TPA: hypothetical protein VF939_25570 [Puia sp.]